MSKLLFALAVPLVFTAAGCSKTHQRGLGPGRGGVETADWLGEKSVQLSGSEKMLIRGVTGYVNSNPVKAVGMALVAGAILARIL